MPIRQKHQFVGCGSTSVILFEQQSISKRHILPPGKPREFLWWLKKQQLHNTGCLILYWFSFWWEIKEVLNKSGYPVLDEDISTCPFWCLGSFGFVCRQEGLILWQYHLRVLLRLEKPMPTQVSSTLSPPLSSSPHGLVSILNIIWKKLFKCRKNSIV